MSVSSAKPQESSFGPLFLLAFEFLSRTLKKSSFVVVTHFPVSLCSVYEELPEMS